MSKKNIKNNKKNSTRKNYKIEPLEPRLMMTAESSLSDLEQQIESVSDSVDNYVNSISSLQLSDAGFDSSLDSASQVFANAGDSVETVIKNVLNDYKAAIDPTTTKVDLDSLVAGLSSSAANLGLSNVSFAKNGDDKVVVNFAYVNDVAATEMSIADVGVNVDNTGANLKASATISIEIDVDKNVLSANVDDVAVTVQDFKDFNVSANFMNLSVTEEKDSGADLELSYDSASASATSELDLEFKLDATKNDSFPFEFSDANDVVKINKAKDGTYSVALPELNLKSGFSNFSLERVLNGLDFDKIPFVRDYAYGGKNIASIVGDVQEYWAKTSFAVNGAVEKVNGTDYQLDLEKIADYFGVLIGNSGTVSSVLDGVTLGDNAGNLISLLDGVKNGSMKVALSDTSTPLYIEFKPLVSSISENLNFGLLKMTGLDVECTVKVEVDVHVDSSTGSLCFDSFGLNDFNLTISKKGINEEITLGLFKAKVVDGAFELEVGYDQSSNKLVSKPKFSVESAELKTGSVVVGGLKKQTDRYEFEYDSLTGNWIVPDDIKSFAALSGETLSHQVIAYLQSMQNALRKNLEEKVKMDFLGGSIGAVVDIIDKIDIVVNGYKDELDSRNDVEGLLKLEDGRYSANFASVEEFVYRFNVAWERVFGKSDVCSLLAVDALQSHKMKVEWDDSLKKVKAEFEKIPSTFAFENFRLEFKLGFDESKNFDLNLAKSLGENFANVSTYGNVVASCDAALSFSLDVNFKREVFSDLTVLDDVLSSIPQNETYYEWSSSDKLKINSTRNDIYVDSKLTDYAFTFKINDNLVFVSTGDIDKADLFSYVEKTDDAKYKKLPSTGLPVIEYNAAIKRLVITDSAKFDISSSENADAFSELKLLNTIQQTCCTKSSSSGVISISLKGVNGAKNEIIKINVGDVSAFAQDLYDKGMAESNNWIDCLDDYLSLQWAGSDKFGLANVLSVGSLEKGCSIKNTFGLYVVDVDHGSGNILFGCNPTLVKDYATEKKADKIDVISKYYELSDTNAKYMRVSGVLNASGVIGSEKGILLERYALDVAGGTFNYDSMYLASPKNDSCFTSCDVEGDAFADAEDLNDIIGDSSIMSSALLNKFTAEKAQITDENGNSKYSVGVFPKDSDNACWRIVEKTNALTVSKKELVLEKYQVVGKKLVLVDSIKLDSAETLSYGTDSTVADSYREDLVKELDKLCKGAFSLSCENNSGNYSIKVVSNKTEIFVATISDKFLEIDAGGSAVYVDTKNCTELTDLSRTIADSVGAKGVNSVSVNNNNSIIFAVAEGSSLKCAKMAVDSTDPAQGTKKDFVLEDRNGHLLGSVDFETLCGGIKGTAKLDDVVREINTKLTGVSLHYYGYGKSGSVEYWDHLEFRSNDEFLIKSVGSSKVLEMLGFSAMTASKCGDNDYRIVGKALLGIDWSKLIDFTEKSTVDISAKLTLSIGQNIDYDNDPNKVKVTAGGVTISLKEAADKDAYALGGYVECSGVYFKIVGFDRNAQEEIESITVSRSDYITTKKNVPTNVVWDALGTQFKYVAAVDATFGFVDANLVSSGSIETAVKFSAQKTKSNENDSFLSNWTFDASCSTPSGKFEVGGAVSVPGLNTVYLGDNTIALKLVNGLPSVDPDFDELTKAISDNLAELTKFSVQDVYALLDALVDRLTTVAKNCDYKIPVINKSVSDLVNVANDIRDIVNKLRKDNVVSLQGFNERLTKYLVDAGLTAAQNATQLFKMQIKNNDVLLDFNISKAFSAVHDFNFSGAKGGISGNADLKVTGDFWFSLSVKLNTKGSIDFLLDNEIQFGANIDIVGEKLSFNLGIDGDSKNDDFMKLLKNLITVGSDKSSSFVVGKAALVGTFGQKDMSLMSWELFDEDGDPQTVVPCFALPMSIFGNLPVSVCGYELGSIKFGKWDDSSDAVICSGDINGLSSYLKEVASFSDKWLKNHNEKPTGSVNLIFERDADGVETKIPDIALLLKDEKKGEIHDGNLVVDISSVYDRIIQLVDGNLDWFDKIKLAVTGLNNLLDSLESKINDGMMSDLKSMPVVGNALSGGVDFLSKFKDSVLEPFSDFVYESTGMTAQMVAQKLDGLFGSLDKYDAKNKVVVDRINALLADGWEKQSEGVYYKSDAMSAEWFFTLCGEYSFGSDIGLDLGFPGLGLETDAGVDLKLKWQLNFGMKVSESGGFEFFFVDKDDVKVEVVAGLHGDVIGKIAGLGLKLDLGGTKGSTNSAASGLDAGVSLSFGVDIDHEKTYGSELKGISLSQIMGELPDFHSEASVNMLVGMKVGVVTDVKGDAPKFPNIDGQFEFVWDKENGIKVLGFKDFYLDMGSFIGGVLGPVVSKIQKVVEPIKPLIDFLTTPFPVLDDLGIVMTPLSLAKEFSKGKFDDSMVYAIKDLIALSEKISAFGSNKELKIKLGDMPLIGSGGKREDVDKFVNGNTSVSEFGKLLDDTTKGYLAMSPSLVKDASSTLSGNGFQVGNGAWKFIWDEPTNIFKLLLGQDVDLIHYDMPKLSFDFEWDTFVRIWAPLGVRLGVSFNASIDLGFGYDTLGIRQWIGSDYKDFARLLNGFYVDDLDEKGFDKPELSFYGGLKASAELNAGVSAGVGGGVGINVGFNLFDPNKDGKLRLSEMKTLLSEEGLFGMFDVEGAITAKLYAYLDLYLYRDEWNITDDITLFEFGYTHTVKPVMISQSGNDVVANIGSNASSRVSTEGVNKTLTDGDEVLNLKISGKSVKDDYGHSADVEPDGKLIVNAEKGNDRITISSDSEIKFDVVINGGDGDDYIDLSGLKVEKDHYVLITGGAGADTIIGAQGLNIIFGDEGVLRVDEENKDGKKTYHLTATSNVDANKAGGDIILGGSAHDIILGGAGDDQIDGGDGVDYIIGDGGSWSVETGLKTSDTTNVSAEQVVEKALSDVATTYGGTSGNGNIDNVKVSRTEISLSGGSDTLIGGAGNDVIYGGGGDDHIDGGAGDDEIHGEKGHDRIVGGSDNDTVYGGEGMDIIFGDRINGSQNVYSSFTANGKHAFSQEFVEAQFKGDVSKLDNVTIKENEFKIKLVDENGKSLTPFASELKGKYQKNKDGETDSNLVANNLIQQSFDSHVSGDDTINGDDGNDLLLGDDGANNEFGGADTINGGIGNDVISGEGGNDTLKGGIDNDVIYGGDNDDIIDGGAGNDSLYGDRGVTDYKQKSSKVDAAVLTNNGNGGNKLVFGDNLGLHGEIYENAESLNAGGNDKITTGPGMDFVDGQGGSDKITVNLMGEGSVGYANITNSGRNDSDKLVVEGTENRDNLLMRRSEDEKLGFIALLPEKADKNDLSLNTNIERINFTSSILNVNLNANGGNDNIVVDGTAETTNIDGGAGVDTIQIGQLYNSQRVFTGGDSDPAMVQPVDEFRTEKTNEEKYLSDGVSLNTTLNVDGNIGKDTFVALNNKGSLNMVGGKGNDKFSIYSFQDENDNTIVRGPVSIDGGAGNDSMFVRGTNGDDTVVLSKEGLLSNVVSVKAAGVETSTFDAAAGDDIFNVISNNKGEINNLNGGKGNDTFNIGSLDADYTLRGASTEGQSCDIKCEVFDESNQIIESSIESYTVIDTSTEPVVFVSAKEDKIAPVDLSISEGGYAEFYLHYAGDLLNGNSFNEIVVNLSAPMLSEKALKSGAREIMLAEVTIDETTKAEVDGVYQSVLPVTLSSSKRCVKIKVHCFGDNLVEDESLKSISVSCVCDETTLTKSVSSIALKVNAEKTSRDADVNMLLAEAEEFSLSGDSVQLSDLASSPNVQVSAYFVGEDGFLTEGDGKDFKIDTTSRVLHLATPVTKKSLVVVYRSNTMRIDSSKAHLAYDDVDLSKINIFYKADGSKDFVDVSTLDLKYELRGDTIVFFNSINQRMMTLHGELKISPKNTTDKNVFLPPEAGLTTGQTTSPVANSSVVISSDAKTLTESGSFNATSLSVSYRGSFAGGEFVTVRINVLDAVNAANKDGSVSTGKELEFVDASGNVIGETVEFTFTPEDASQPQMVYLRAKADLVAEEYGYVTAHETEEKRINGVEGAVYAFGMGASVDLDVDSPTMLSYAHKVEVNAGLPEEANKFNEKNEYDASKLFDFANLNGKAFDVTIDASNASAMAILSALGIDLQKEKSFEGKTIRFVATDKDGIEVVEDEVKRFVHESAWFKVISCKKNENGSFTLTLDENVTLFTTTNSKVLFSGSKDYLFIDEDNSVDRLFVNNQSDSDGKSSSLNGFDKNSGNLNAAELAAFGGNADVIKANIETAEASVLSYDSNALRFNHEDIGSRGIAAAQMEYGEYNLGTGKDHVEINKTLYRDDAFRTFTVVNTGDDKNASAFGSQIGSGLFVSRSVTESVDASFHYDFNVFEGDSDVDVSDDADNIYYVEAVIKKLKNGSTTEYESTKTRQRREIVGDFSSAKGFNIKYDFILADDEAIEGFVFYCAEFDDEIVINSYQSDRENENSTVICSGMKVSKNVSAPAEESAATETLVASEESAAEGDAPAATEETGTAESESSAADTPAETETTGEEGTATADADKPAGPSGNIYSFTMNADDTADFAKNYEDAWKDLSAKNENRDSNANASNLYVDAMLSDGSVQRRVVNGMTSNTFGIDRDFTLSDGVTIVSVKFAYNYTGDGQLVINAQSGNDKIDASSNDVTRNDMVVFGGLGDDYITMNKGGIAFGDRGQVKYDNGQVNGKTVGETVLGSILSKDGNAYYGDYTTGIDKQAKEDAQDAPAHRLQTDGVNRDAKDIHSVDDANGGVDMIYVGGTNSVVIGGAEGDVIAVGGNKNVVLGDNGRVNYKNATNANAVYGDELGLGLYKVETTSDDVGEVDNIVIAGNKNVAMGGDKGDSIRITGADNVAIGDAGRYTVEKDRLYAESKQESDDIGGKDYISTGDGKNAVIGGTDSDTIRTGAGNDAIIGDGGIVIMDTDRNMLMVSNEGRNIVTVDKNEQTFTYEDGSAGIDDINAGDGDNVVFGGLNKDDITTGSGKDVVLGDNGYATFRGNANEAWYKGYDEKRPNVHDVDSTPTVYSEATLSFNFQGPAQNGIGANEEAGAADYAVRTLKGNEIVETTEHAGLHVGNWNNIYGHEAGTYGDNDDEIVLFDNGTRASAVSVSYGASENHRVNTTDGDRIRLHGYSQEYRFTASNSGDYNLMKSGLDTSGNNARNTLHAQVDGLDQYFTNYDVVVYLDMVNEVSWAGDSVRVVTLYRDYVDSNGVVHSDKFAEYYVNDPESNTFNGKWVVATAKTAEDAKKRDKEGHLVEQANCVIFKGVYGDRFHVEITDGDGANGFNNGKDRAGIAGIQVTGRLHKQDVAATTDINYGGDDVIRTNGGDDIVVGGTGSDKIKTYGDDRYGLYDNDVVFGDNAKMVFTDRDNNLDTASTISSAESITSKNLSANYDDMIKTGDGNDVVVGGSGSDKIDSGATAQADEMLDELEVYSLNFTDVSTDQSTLLSKGEGAGVVVDNDWHNAYIYNHQPRVHEADRDNAAAADYALHGIKFQYDCYGNTDAPTEVTNASMDADTSNNKMMMNYVGGHNQDPLTVSVWDIPKPFADKKYDIYVYIDGINGDSDAHDYIFEIKGPNNQTYYLNDWSGCRFDGDFKQVTCDSYQQGTIKDGITPSVEMIGNYVVFHGVSDTRFRIDIQCVDSSSGTQNRNDLPVITAIQLVASTNSDKKTENMDINIGGDHDKDFVMGDDASLNFDLDIPFAADESIADYDNRLVSAKSMSVAGPKTADEIKTGKDRDVVIGGEGNDEIDVGSGDDIVIGNTVKSVYVEHNNPVGVFRPNVNIVLEDNDYNVAEPRPYLDGQGGNKEQIRSMVQGGQVEGIKLDNQNTANDTVYEGSGKNLVFNGHVNNEGGLDENLVPESLFDHKADEVLPIADNDQPVDDDDQPVIDDNQPSGDDDQPVIDDDQPSGDDDQPIVDYIRTIETPIDLASVTLEQGEKVKVVFRQYPKADNYNPNLHLQFYSDGPSFADLVVELYSNGQLFCYDVGSSSWKRVDIADHVDSDSDFDGDNCAIYVSSNTATSFKVHIVQ